MSSYSSIAAQRAAEEAQREKRRNYLRSQIRGLENEIEIYNTQISSLEFKLEQQRAIKVFFDGKCTNLDAERAAKSVCAQKLEPYVVNLKFDLGYTTVMDELLYGSTSQSYEGYRQETGQYMQNEINENQTTLDELERTRDARVTTMASLNYELARL